MTLLQDTRTKTDRKAQSRRKAVQKKNNIPTKTPWYNENNLAYFIIIIIPTKQSKWKDKYVNFSSNSNEWHDG